MINFNNIIKSAINLQSKANELFIMSTPNKQSVIVFEDDDLVVSLTLSKMTQTRHIYATIKFKKYKTIEKDSSLMLKIDTNKSIKENLEDVTIDSMVESCISTCNISGLDEVNFIKNGYSLEVVKTSNRYVTITEYINAVPFEKRFDSLENLFNYINYRQKYHSSINIGLNVSESELCNIKRNINVLEWNSEGILTTMLSRIFDLCNITDLKTSQISFQNIKRVQSNTTFDIVLENNDAEFSLRCVYNKIIGVNTTILNDELSSTDIYNLKTLLSILCAIERSYSGYFDKYVGLVLQHSKFKSKITSDDVIKIKQMNPDTTRDKIQKALIKAKSKEEMLSDQIDISSFGGYRRYIVLDGVMKNRKRCTLLVFASKNGNVFEEYQIPIEKNRIFEEARDFLSQYFI